MYVEGESPLLYGIMYSESASQATEIAWYETEKERDDSLNTLLETGVLNIKTSSYRTGKTVKPYAFSSVNGSSIFYVKRKSE